MNNAFKAMHLTITPQDNDRENTYILTTKKDLDDVVRQESLVVCFSKSADLLSQWRGYANDGCGFAIGFDQELLQKYLKRDDRFRIDFVEYDEERQIRMLESDIRVAFLDCAVKNGMDLPLYSRGKGIDFDFSPFQDYYYDEYEEISIDIARKFAFSSCLMKNGAFREEEEVRIVFDSNYSLDLENGFEVDTKIHGTTKLNLGKIDYLVRGRRLVPFVDMDFSKAVKDRLIKEIIIGPKADVSEDELYTYLWHNGLDDVDVRKSSASYV